MLNRILLLLLSSLALFSNGQDHAVNVFSDSRHQYKFPWAGGMNSCQFGKMDLNLDGTKDLVVFDRVGNRIMPFLAVPSGNTFDYQFAPEYAANFPALEHWAIFEDYNLDGKEDIFTYSPGYAGLKVYKNTSADHLEFSLEVFPFLTSFQGGGYVNILVTYADYPAISDLDGDGDLDILTFYGLGSFVEKHRNMSMEKYGHADSLDYVMTESCWGYFAESEETNAIVLDTCLRCMEAWGHGGMEAWGHGGIVNLTADRRPMTTDRHTGSTFRILDLNGDALPDLLLGDVDYPNLIALYNGGNPDTARMSSYDWQYPPGYQKVDLFSMPVAFYDDFDFDGVKDLLVSPFDPNPFLPENFQSSWLYHNDGTNSQPQFSLRTKCFLQDQMLDFGAGAYPVFFDADNDGLTDLMVGNYGYYDTSYFDEYLILHTDQTGQIAYLKNTGSMLQPAFTLVERDFAGISSLNLNGIMPAFGDLDGDGDADMLIGYETGQVISYENNADYGETANFILAEMSFQDIDVGSFSAPQLFDLDRDNLIDLIIGEKGGNLNYYRNTGTSQNPDFSLVTDSLGKINVTDYSVSLDGYSVPFFYRDGSGLTHLLVGSEKGEVFYYTSIDGNLDGKFILSDTLAGLIGVQYLPEDYGYRSSPALVDLDQDGYPESITGNFSGGLSYFSKNAQSPVNQVNDNDSRNDLNIIAFPNPAHELVNISCKACGKFELAEIFLYDNMGRQVTQISGNLYRIMEFNVKYYPRGIYIMRVALKDEKGYFRSAYFEKIILL